ncbi:MAG TPA: sodium/proline symporter [Candidatus Ruania gallistercoris]|uniref:Sodium/proline symporter n=1 Tax=Candidatus Ruania gallistercoris TaxID=2838746 RepID=A0A9D2EF39_9MICO|nr:sodium/proline symporter [Candidatus Ruania gallistercoris]
MSAETLQWMAIALFLVGMLALGYSGNERSRTLPGFLLGEGRLRGGQAGLSAGAADASWWLVLLLPAAAYSTGMRAAWIPVGLIAGALLAWTFLAPRLRSYARVAGESLTLPTFLERRTRDSSHLLRILSAVLILVLLTVYLAAGIRAGGLFFASAFGTSELVGLAVVGGVTTVYVLFGGFRGVANAHVLQAVLIAGGLVLVAVTAVRDLGGWDATRAVVESVTPEATSLLAGGVGAGLVTALAWALGYLGQPQALVRMMALRTPRAARSGRRVLVVWLLVSTGAAIVVGLATVAYFELSWRPLNRPEDAYPRLAELLFSPFVGALLLMVVLAAIMSTVASQLLLCSSALVEDLYRLLVRSTQPRRQHVTLARLAVLLVAVAALLLARRGESGALDLVAFAWAGFGATFAPLVLLSLFWRRLTAHGALAGLVSGAVVMIVWARTGLEETLHELLPAFAINLLVAMLVSHLSAAPGAGVRAEYEEMTDRLPAPSLLHRGAAGVLAVVGAGLAAAVPAPAVESESEPEV